MKRSIKKWKYIYLIFLFSVCLFNFVIIPTYAKFTNDYTTNDDVAGFLFDFDIGISDILEYEKLSVSAGDAKVFNVKVNNSVNGTLYYGVWYRITNENYDSNKVTVAKLKDSDNNTSGEVSANGSATVSIIVKNRTDKNITIDFGVLSSKNSTNDIEYLDGRKLVSGVDEIVYLSKVLVGSYVAYQGSNGCVGNSCGGQNANYVSNNDKGYCANQNNKYKYNGFRVGYISDDTAYLISAGALECLTTNNNGNLSKEGVNIDTFDDGEGALRHINNLNMEALLYCNEEFSYNGVCNNYSAWNINSSDFTKIVGNKIEDNNCYLKDNELCGYGNEIIDTGGNYWISGALKNSNKVFYWDGSNRYVGGNNSSVANGLRPVIRLASSVYVTGGTGTYDDPYNISNELVSNKVD